MRLFPSQAPKQLLFSIVNLHHCYDRGRGDSLTRIVLSPEQQIGLHTRDV